MRPVLPPDLPPHAFLTLEEAANLLNVKLRWMRDAIEDDRIAHYKIGRLVRIQAVDLLQFVARTRVEARDFLPAASRPSETRSAS